MGNLSLEEMLLGFGSLSNGTQGMRDLMNQGLGNQQQDLFRMGSSSPWWLSYTTTNAQDEERLRQMLNPFSHQQSQGLFGQMQQMQGLGLTQQEQLNQQWRAMLPMQPMQCGLGLFSSALSIGGPEPLQTESRPTLWQRFVTWAKRPSRKPFLRTERRFLGVRFYR